MRIDKLLSEMGICSRSEAAKAAKNGGITVDGVTVKRADMHIDPEKCTLIYLGEIINYKSFTYIMLNKPEGYVSATDDPHELTVLQLLDERSRKMGLFPCGRLDKNTVGLLILTNDGNLCHNLISPKRNIEKVYAFRSERIVTEDDRLRLENGVKLDDIMTKPAKVKLYPDARSGEITLTEGKFHQVKRMFEAVCNKIIYLERIEFAGIKLDPSLKRGEWRVLTESEENLLRSYL
jgi:16S rRNA pseudouridine516 synthase